MARNEKSSVSNLQNEEHKRILTSLLREEGNRRCADCNSRGPTWASVNLGVFVCLNCSGIHRSLGVHISKVRSTNLDTWLPEQVAFVQAMGNVRCNTYWEANLPRDFHRPPEADMSALRVFLTDKYVNKRYALTGYNESPCIENYMSHPFLVESGGEGKSSEHNSNAAGEIANTPGAAGGGNCQQQPAIGVARAAPAAVPQFDLLNLDDDPVPVSSLPQQQQAQQRPLPNASAPAPASAPAAGDWDPFAAIARGPVTVTSIASTATAPVPPPLIDPFAEIERTASSWSSGTAATTCSSLGNTTTAAATATTNNPILNNDGAIVVDPFALPPLPPQSTAPAVPVKAPVPAVHSAVQPLPPPQMAMTSSGNLGGSAMRSASSNGHSKGNLSHEDILAMFDK